VSRCLSTKVVRMEDFNMDEGQNGTESASDGLADTPNGTFTTTIKERECTKRTALHCEASAIASGPAVERAAKL
jgi:hypothetical protein